MGRNEIRLRRHRMSSGRISQHRNFGDIIARHQRDRRIRNTVRIFIYFLIIIFMVIVFTLVKRWAERTTPQKKEPHAIVTRESTSAGTSFYPLMKKS